MTLPAFLIGPFIGELSWEFFQFAPYIIHLKKEHPTKKIIVFTRPSRFDLYGNHVDILVPLRIPDDTEENQHCFTIKGFKLDDYNLLIDSVMKKYTNEYDIIKHIYPDISLFYYKLKWQFSRPLMIYDFKPRKNNKKIVRKYLSSHDSLLDNDNIDIENTHIKKVKDLLIQYNELIDKNSSEIGCLIDSIKICKYVIANASSVTARLALLLKTPLITINEEFTDDEIHLVNPYNTPVIRSSNIEEGIKIYEDNF